MSVITLLAMSVSMSAATATPPASGQVSSAVTSTGTDPVSGYQDYLIEATLAAAGADQCTMPVASRVGSWVCTSDSSQEATTDGVTAAAASGYCTTKGCWYYVDDFHAHNDSSGSFGYGTKVLGSVKMDSYHNLNGAKFITGASFYCSTAVKNLHATGDMLHGSHTGPGDEVAGQFDIKSKSSLASATWWYPWGNTKYSSYDTSYLNHANVIEFAWEKTGYPGYWYIYQKSIIADDPNNNNIYGFNDSDYMFTSSASSGYHSS